MFRHGFWDRLLRVKTVKQILLSADWMIAGSIVIVLYQVLGGRIMRYDVDTYIGSATSLSQSLIPVTIAGVAIIVSFTDRRVLATLDRIDVYESLMLVFELTALLSVVTTIIGILIQSYSYGSTEVYLFTFVFAYLVVNALTLISTIVTFGQKMAEVVMVEGLPDNLDELIGFRDASAEDPGQGETDSARSDNEAVDTSK